MRAGSIVSSAGLNSTTRLSGEVRPALQPPDAAEAPVQSYAGERHQSHHDEVAVFQLEFRDVLEVHPVDAGDCGRDGEDREPRGELLGDRGLLRLADKETRLER